MTEAVAPRRTARPDAVAAAAVDLARSAAEQEAGAADLVGEHLGADAEPDAERVVTHRFACTDRAYAGWYWAVTVARASRAKTVTVDEAVLLPGADALLSPDWVPYAERLRPGDVGAGDLLPTAADDPRLVLRPEDVEDAADQLPFLELGLGRSRVLGLTGREDASERWYAGDAGPQAPAARQAPGSCSSCGFSVRLIGALGRLFAVCANVFAADDGRVVSVDHGCGAHSEAVLPQAEDVPVPVLDDDDVEVVDFRLSHGDPPD